MTVGLVIQAVLFAAATSIPFLAGARATVDPDDGHYSRTRPARSRTQRAAWSGTAGAGETVSSPAPAPGPDGRGAEVSPTAASVGLHRERVRG